MKLFSAIALMFFLVSCSNLYTTLGSIPTNGSITSNDVYDVAVKNETVMILFHREFISTYSNLDGHRSRHVLQKNELYYGEVKLNEFLDDEKTIKFKRIGSFNLEDSLLVFDFSDEKVGLVGWGGSCSLYVGSCREIFEHEPVFESYKIYPKHNNKIEVNKSMYIVGYLSTDKLLKIRPERSGEGGIIEKKYTLSGDMEAPFLTLIKAKQ
jgi:hypothetical protein